MTEYNNIRLEMDGQVAVLTMLHETMDVYGGFCEEMQSALDGIVEDPHAHSVILKNDGRYFCAGGKLDPEKNNATQMQARNIFYKSGILAKTLSSMPKPVIALVNGAASGGGANLALSCDFILASEKALFREVFVNINLIPDTGGLWNLVRLIGPMRAKQLCMTRCKVSAEEALKYGMITELVSSEQLWKRGMALANELASKPPASVAAIKQLCWKLPEMTFDTYLESETSMMALLRGTEDYREGALAFKEKREPRFSGK